MRKPNSAGYKFYALRQISWLTMTLLALVLFCSTALYWSFRTDINFLLVKQHLIEHPIWIPVFYTHLVGGMLSIILGPFQFLKRFRAKYIKWHRDLGKVYVMGVLLIGAPTGLYMAFFAEGGLLSTLGFIMMSIVWFYTTYKAVSEVRKGNIQAHKQWMVRSYAMTFSAVTLRLLVPLFSLGLGMDQLSTVISTAWISWALNLIIAELIIRAPIHPIVIGSKPILRTRPTLPVSLNTQPS